MRTKYIQIIVLVLCILHPSMSWANEKKDEVVKIYSSSVVKKNNGHPLQVGIIEIGDRSIESIDVELGFSGGLVELHFSDLDKKFHVVHFGFPVLKKRELVDVRVLHGGVVVFDSSVQFDPPKEWKIYDVQVSHHDLGYADYYHMMRRDVREMAIEMAMDFARKTDSWPEESRFHWTVETSEPLIEFLSRQTEGFLKELKGRVDAGQIVFGGIHNSVSTEHLGYEAMARQFYTPNRYVCDWYGTAPSKTALNTDVVGFSRALALYSKEADIPYFMFGRNSTVDAFDKAEDDMAFYWQSPDKDSKMTLYKVWHYYSPDRLSKYDIQEIAALCKTYESHENYPYSCILAEDSYDFGMPEFENIEGIKKWNEEYVNPVLVSGTFDMYFDDLANQQEKGSFKTYEKDVPNAWADEDMTDVEYANKARRLNSSLPSVEKWGTIASVVSASAFPWIDIYQAYHAMLMWGEHTNGAYAEGPIFAPPSLDDHSAANATYYEFEQEMHRDLIREGEYFKDRAEKVALGQLASEISTNAKNTLVVMNPLVRERSDYVRFDMPEGKGLSRIVDNVSGEEVKFQWGMDSEVFFFAEGIPSMGYKTYKLDFSKKEVSPDFRTERSPVLENAFYKVEFDSKSGGIQRLFDKGLGRELVDQDARFKLNEYYYERFESNTYEGGTKKYQAESASFQVFHGEIADVVLSEVEAVGADKIIQKVTIYKHLNRIDFEVSFDKDDSGRTLDDYRNYSPKGKEGLFYCLPFDVPEFTIRHELSGGVMEPIEDQFKGSSTDYYGIQHFSDISNDDWGISLATVEPNLVEYGKPRPAHWSKGDDYEHVMEKAEDSHFYLYLLNNMFFTNIRQTQPGPKSFKWSVRSHEGNWQEGKAYQFGRDVANPLSAFISTGKKKGTLPAGAKSFVRLDSEDVLCSTIKPAESNGEGYILRFVEVSGREQTVQVDVPFIDYIERANFTNLVEVDRDYRLELEGDNSFRFHIPAFGLRTIRVTPGKNELVEIAEFEGLALSDSKVKLSWEMRSGERAGLSYFKVYRSEDPGFEPSFRTFVANTDQMEYIDRPALHIRGWQSNRLKADTDYYYKIEAVGVNNRAGKYSSGIKIRTLKRKEADEMPNKVIGLRATLVSPITGHNYIGLYFYTNVEEDVNKYVVYRSKAKGKIPSESDILAVMDVREEIEHVTPHGYARVTRPLKAYNRQLFIDEDVEPFTRYYYWVAAMDDGGMIGACSEVASSMTGIGNLQFEGQRCFREQSEVKIVNLNKNDWEIRYTVDGSDPGMQSKLYVGPIEISEDASFCAALFAPGDSVGSGIARGEYKKMNDYDITYHTKYQEKWKSTGDIALIDNYRGEVTLGSKWQGFEVDDLDVVIDLKELREVESVSVGCLQNVGNWVFFPDYIEVSVSEDGENFEIAGRIETIKEWQRLDSKMSDLRVTFKKRKCRYVRVYAKNIAQNPVWHNFAGGKAWLFVDEIVIE